ncbi:MAG: hypothetical protein HQL51_03390, partial [Magnetococcales bacterium]|nr:hypothetical protein [Magnetococcales bacterium]
MGRGIGRAGGVKISTFRAREMREVLREVRETLGDDAVILSTRRVREKSKSGLPIGPELIEVTACPSPAAPERPAPERPSASAGRYESREPPAPERPSASAGRYESREP